jgi:hypothetical protein
MKGECDLSDINIIDLSIYIEIEGDESKEFCALIPVTFEVRWGTDLSFNMFWHVIF